MKASLRASGVITVLALVGPVAPGCRPGLDDRPWLVTERQIVGWKAEPPEVNPGSSVTLQVVALEPAGAVDASGAEWTICRTPKPLAESRVVDPACLPASPPPSSSSSPPAPDAIGDPVALAVPTDACRTFGPDPPQPARGAAALRPRDPDATGGYYQPFAIQLDSARAVGLERVHCDLPGASLAAARAFHVAYQLNQNPTITGLAFTIDGAPADSAAIPAGARVRVAASWADGSAEPFPLFDPASGAVVDARETLAAAWFVTGGQLERAADLVSGSTLLETTATWDAPAAPGRYGLVFVLRDSRGGADALEVDLLVTAAP